MIKKNHPVVTKVKTDGPVGVVEVFEERTSVEKAIAGHFTEIYRRPNHMVAQVDDGEQPMTDEIPASTMSSEGEIKRSHALFINKVLKLQLSTKQSFICYVKSAYTVLRLNRLTRLCLYI